MNNIKEKIKLHPVMTFLILTAVTMVISGVLNILDFSEYTYSINSTTLEYSLELSSVENLFSIAGLRYIFSETVANFVNFTPFSTLIIVLIGFGVMEKSGFLKTAITFITKKMKKNTVTFLIIFVSIISSVMGDISYVIMLPLSALIFKYGKRNPLIGVVASFAGLTCGYGLSFIFTSVDSSLLSQSLLAARVIDISYRMASISGIFIMAVAVFLIAIVLTNVTEKVTSSKFGKYELEEEVEEKPMTKKELRGLLFAIFGAFIYLIVFLYNIVPGLPFSGNLLDNSQILYIDKLFSYNSFFSKGFVFIVTIFFIILGLFYGLGARTMKDHKDFVSSLWHSLDGVGETIVLIFGASLFISVFKYSYIGETVVSFLASIFQNTSFQGIALIVLLFIVSMVATFIVPGSISKWSILSPVVIPVFMNAGMTPEFAQIIFRFGESVTMGLTPIMASFVIYLAILNKNTKEKEIVNILTAIKYQIPYAVITGLILIVLLIAWYVVGLPLGINGATVL